MQDTRKLIDQKIRIYSLESCHKAKNGVKIPIDLCLYTPKEVFAALLTNSHIISWLEFISKRYFPPNEKTFLLLYPCSTIKPYSESRSYKALFKTLSSISSDREQKIHVVTISEPFGLVPEEFFDQFPVWYDCPGLFEWWCKKHKLPYSDKYLERCIEFLAIPIANFLARTKKHYKGRLAFIRTFSSNLKRKKDHTHVRILERAIELSGVAIKILPDKSWVTDIVSSRGTFAWDMYGVAHPKAQNFLLNFLNNGGMKK